MKYLFLLIITTLIALSSCSKEHGEPAFYYYKVPEDYTKIKLDSVKELIQRLGYKDSGHFKVGFWASKDKYITSSEFFFDGVYILDISMYLGRNFILVTGINVSNGAWVNRHSISFKNKDSQLNLLDTTNKIWYILPMSKSYFLDRNRQYPFADIYFVLE